MAVPSSQASNAKPLAIVFVDDTFEDLEFHYPRLRLIEAGFHVETVGPAVKGNFLSKHGYWGAATKLFKDIDPAQVAVCVVPGGMCTDRLRRYPEATKLCTAVWENGSCVLGFICHGGWLPISAKVSAAADATTGAARPKSIVHGHRVTSFFAIRDDLENAGAEWVDEKCVVDGRMVTAQTPEDLPAFMKAILEVHAASKQA